VPGAAARAALPQGSTGALTPAPRLSVALDPSSYGGEETMVTVVHSQGSGLAAYLPNQTLSKRLCAAEAVQIGLQEPRTLRGRAQALSGLVPGRCAASG
jgi:hypothetical protein